MILCNVLSELEFKPRTSKKSDFNNYVSRCKNIFREYVFEQEFNLFGKKVKLVFDDDFQKCFDKFFIGDPNNHNFTHKYDGERLNRVKWVYDIMSNLSKCGSEKTCSGYIYSMYKHNNKPTTVIYCETYRYGLFFEDKCGKSGEYYLLKSAYHIDYDETVDKILENRIN